jgi:hypothetical protein
MPVFLVLHISEGLSRHDYDGPGSAQWTPNTPMPEQGAVVPVLIGRSRSADVGH